MNIHEGQADISNVEPPSLISELFPSQAQQNPQLGEYLLAATNNNDMELPFEMQS